MIRLKDGSVEISVIMPVYNKEAYIRQAIESVLDQKGVSVELICVDDGSTDRSVEAVEAYCKSSDQIVLCCQKNMGAGCARNNGMSQARGQYLSFLDPDDWYPSEFSLYSLLKGAREAGVAVAMGRRLYYVKPFVMRRTDCVFSGGVHLAQELESAFLYQSCLFERNLIETGGISFPDYRRFQDPPFFLTAMTSSRNFVYVNEAVHCYRRGVQKISWDEKKLCDYANGAKDCLEICLKEQMHLVFDQVTGSLNHSSFTQGVFDVGGDRILSLLRSIEDLVRSNSNNKSFRIRALALADDPSWIKNNFEVSKLRLENYIKSVF